MTIAEWRAWDEKYPREDRCLSLLRVHIVVSKPKCFKRKFQYLQKSCFVYNIERQVDGSVDYN